MTILKPWDELSETDQQKWLEGGIAYDELPDSPYTSTLREPKDITYSEWQEIVGTYGTLSIVKYLEIAAQEAKL